jgi:hypothetical protein
MEEKPGRSQNSGLVRIPRGIFARINPEHPGEGQERMGFGLASNKHPSIILLTI